MRPVQERQFISPSSVVAISQRVVVDAATSERRDALDQRWARFASAIGCVLWPVANDPALARQAIRTVRPRAIILSGGNDVGVGVQRETSLEKRIEAGAPDAPERDGTERALLNWATDEAVPVLGVCRGMQVMNLYWGGRLGGVERSEHVARRHAIHATTAGLQRGLHDGCEVNSFHQMGLTRDELSGVLVPLAFAGAVVEAVAHTTLQQIGIMWHPEREPQVSAHERDFLRRSLGLLGSAHQS